MNCRLTMRISRMCKYFMHIWCCRTAFGSRKWKMVNRWLSSNQFGCYYLEILFYKIRIVSLKRNWYIFFLLKIQNVIKISSWKKFYGDFSFCTQDRDLYVNLNAGYWFWKYSILFYLPLECVTRVCDSGVNERIGSLITKVDRYVCGAVSIVSSEPSFELTLKERVWIIYFCRSILKLNLERII